VIKVASGFNFFEVLSQFKDVLKFVVRYYPMVKSVLNTIDEYIDNPLLDKIIFYISKAEELGLSGPEKKKFVMENAKTDGEIVDKIVGIINKFKG
jgi:hypothetical protein